MAYHLPLSTDDVQGNRERFIAKCNLQDLTTVFMNQSHSDTAVIVEESGVYEADAIITGKKELALAVMVADCIPMFFYDPINEAIAAIHAGRVGTLNAIAKKTLNAMQTAYGTNSEDLLVYIGPSIGKCCYEVSTQIASVVKKGFGNEFVTKRNIDLKKINQIALLNEGVEAENIIMDSTCTKCYSEQFYSYRKDKEQSGRFIGVITLK